METAAERPPILPAELHDALGNAIAQGKIALPALPAVASELLTATFDENCDFAHTEAILQKDPHLAGQVLRTANSAIFATTTPITNLRRALAHLGLGRVRSVAMMVACESRVYVIESFRAQAERLFRHAKTVSMLARDVAAHAGVDADEASLLGLMHDVGRAVLLQSIEQLRVVLRVKLKRRIDVDPAAALAATTEHHAQVGADVLRKWSLPPALLDAVLMHHTPDALEHEALRRLVAAVRLADLLANEDAEPAQQAAEGLGIGADALDDLRRRAAECAAECAPA